MLTAGEVAGARETAAAALPDVATVERRSVLPDGGGGTTETWSAVATVACRVAPSAGGEGGQTGDRADDESTHVVTVPAGTDVGEPDRLTVAGTSYEVLLVRRRGGWEITRRVEVREVR